MQVLIVGLGSIGKKHIAVLAKNVTGLKIQALRSKDACEEHEGIDNIYSWDKVTPPAFILICNPTSLHSEAIEKAIDYGCPLFIEKPLFHRYEEHESLIIKKIIDRNIKTYIACNLRFHPVIKFLKTFLQENNKINEVNIYCGSYLPSWRPGKDFAASYSSKPELGGGVHLDLIHELDYATYIFGKPTEIHSILTNNSSLGIAAVDSAHYMLKYDGFSVSLTLNYFRRDAKRFIEIVREDDTLMCDLLNCSVINTVNNTLLFNQENFNMNDTYIDQMKYFLKFKDSGLMNDIKEAAEVLRIALT